MRSKLFRKDISQASQSPALHEFMDKAIKLIKQRTKEKRAKKLERQSLSSKRTLELQQPRYTDQPDSTPDLEQGIQTSAAVRGRPSPVVLIRTPEEPAAVTANSGIHSAVDTGGKNIHVARGEVFAVQASRQTSCIPCLRPKPIPAAAIVRTQETLVATSTEKILLETAKQAAESRLAALRSYEQACALIEGIKNGIDVCLKNIEASRNRLAVVPEESPADEQSPASAESDRGSIIIHEVPVAQEIEVPSAQMLETEAGEEIREFSGGDQRQAMADTVAEPETKIVSEPIAEQDGKVGDPTIDSSDEDSDSDDESRIVADVLAVPPVVPSSTGIRFA